MTRIGITGHQNLEHPEWVGKMITEQLLQFGEGVEALSSLAVGADQLFAEIALSLKLPLTAVVPCKDYELTFEVANDLKAYRDLLQAASKTIQLDWPKPSEGAFYAAGKKIVEQSDVLIAVWNGLPARGLGGTADAVKYAQSEAKKVIHINPVSQELRTYG